MQAVWDAKMASGRGKVTRSCGKRVRIDSIVERILRCHIEAMVLPPAFHGAVHYAKSGEYFFAHKNLITPRDWLCSERKRPGRVPGPCEADRSSVASAAARAATIGALVDEVPSTVLREERGVL